MMRILGFIGASVALVLSATGARAQTASAPSEFVSCPRARLSIYFASGQITASPEALALIGRISETAANCQPDRIDLVARIDARADGKRAVELALARLSAVADDLIAKGVSVESIRIAAQAAGPAPSPTFNQIDVLFKKTGDTADVAASPSAPLRTAPGEAI
ncbi:MAG: hypothetical protein Q8R82_12280 [Hyphomonadaceae bacterium]|nr:hypothetical protein [Hyphomonadaceae bacterium]